MLQEKKINMNKNLKFKKEIDFDKKLLFSFFAFLKKKY